MTYEVLVDPSRCGEVAALLQALGHPVRLRIVCALLGGRCNVSPMVDGLGLPQPLVSRHLAILREAGVVRAAREGRRQVYRVVHPAVPPLVELLESVPLREEAP